MSNPESSRQPPWPRRLDRLLTGSLLTAFVASWILLLAGGGDSLRYVLVRLWYLLFPWAQHLGLIALCQHDFDYCIDLQRGIPEDPLFGIAAYSVLAGVQAMIYLLIFSWGRRAKYGFSRLLIIVFIHAGALVLGAIPTVTA